MTKKQNRDPLVHLHPPLESLPKTMPDAVAYVIASMSQQDRDAVRGCPCEYLGEFHHGLGTWLRNHLGLWGRNSELVANLPVQHRFGDAASRLILEEVWLALQAQDAEPTPTPETGHK